MPWSSCHLCPQAFHQTQLLTIIGRLITHNEVLHILFQPHPYYGLGPSHLLTVVTWRCGTCYMHACRAKYMCRRSSCHVQWLSVHTLLRPISSLSFQLITIALCTLNFVVWNWLHFSIAYALICTTCNHALIYGNNSNNDSWITY